MPHRPLPVRKVEGALKILGFTPDDDGTGSSHEHWRQVRDGRLYKVTVAPHRGEVRALDVASIIKQAGVSKKDFWRAVDQA